MTKNEYVNTTDRPAGDYVLFALAFVGFGMAAGGVVLVSPFLALSGPLILLLAVACFNRGP